MFIRPNWFVAAKRLRQMPEKEGGAEGREKERERMGAEQAKGASLGQTSSSFSVWEQELYSLSVLSWCQSKQTPADPLWTHTCTTPHTYWNSQVNSELIFWMEMDWGSLVAPGINRCWLTYLWCLIVHRKCQKVNRPTCQCVNSAIDFIDALALCWTSLNQTCQAPPLSFHSEKMDIWLVLSPFSSTRLCITVRYLLHIAHHKAGKTLI